MVGMVDVRRGRALVAAFAALAIGCGSPLATPSDVVRGYFDALARDPIRTLPLLTDAFHRRHALRVVTSADAEGRPSEPTATALAIDRHQLGWLAVQSRPELARLLAGEATQIDDDRERGDIASIAVRVAPREAPPFEQRFALVRSGPLGSWRIDAIEQSGVVPENEAAAFATYPNEAARRALAARQGR
jgi:hypothetical protein